jgi:hypothetical protein
MSARGHIEIKGIRDGLRKAQLEAEQHYAEFRGDERNSKTAGYWKGLALAFKLSAGDLDLLLGEDTRKAGEISSPGDCACGTVSDPPACFRCKHCGRTGE